MKNLLVAITSFIHIIKKHIKKLRNMKKIVLNLHKF